MQGRNILVAGLGFGDCGKGATVDWLARHTGARLVVRYNGSCQCGHRVVLSDGREHIFSQFGSASFLPGARTFLSRYVPVDPLALVSEGWALTGKLGLDVPPIIAADRRCLMVTPWHRAANRLRELGRGAQRHGSCGRGVGETIRVSFEYPDITPHLAERRDFYDLLQALRERLLQEVEPWFELDPDEAYILRMPSSVQRFIDAIRPFYALCRMQDGLQQFRHGQEEMIFEGAQGVLLDQDRGIGAPDHATWSRCDFSNAEDILAELPAPPDVYKLGVIRTHLTRHGAGPFPTENEELPPPHHDHNSHDPWQGTPRIGAIDQATAKRASRIIGHLDGLALTHTDWTPAGWRYIADATSTLFGAPVVVTSDGPTAEHRWLEGESR